MNRQTFAWDASRWQLSRRQTWLEFVYVFGLFLAALLLFCLNLDSLPLRDWDEATVAQVAKEIANAPAGSNRWLFPTLWEQPYLNKPPLVHNLIALVYGWIGVNEWTSRLPGALLSAISVPLLYGIGRQIFPNRVTALFASLVYLTLLPVVRHGRLAMLDGPVLCFQLLMFWSVLRSRRDLRWALGAGVAFGLICLTKGPMALLLGLIALLFLAWDTPRLLSSPYLWGGIFLGSLPVLAWYGAQWYVYADDFWRVKVWQQSFARLYTAVDQHQGPPWYYLLELLKYSLPWLPFSIAGLKLAWQHRLWGWGKLILVWTGVYFLVISLMGTKLPWYILPLYPALALAAGVKLEQMRNRPLFTRYSRFWLVLFGLLALGASFAACYFSFNPGTSSDPQALAMGTKPLVVILIAVAVTMGVITVLIARQDSQFIPLLFWGLYLSLLLFVTSGYWNWELNEAYAVKPVAALIQQAKLPKEAVIYTSFPYERPSLNFYSEHRILAAKPSELESYWQAESSPYLLLEKSTFLDLNLEDLQVIGAWDSWLLITKHP